MQQPKLDEWYTPASVALRCVQELIARLTVSLSEFDSILEPSAGEGAFVRALETAAGQPLENLSWIDINSQYVKTRQDYLTFEPASVAKRLVVGNPPFGKRGRLAMRFFNHAAKHAHVIAFILPLCCASPRQQNLLDLHFHCLYSARLGNVSFEGRLRHKVFQCVWQIWCRQDMVQALFGLSTGHVLRPVAKELVETCDFKFVSDRQSKSAQVAIRKTGKHAGSVLMPTANCKVLWIQVKEGRNVDDVIGRLKRASIAQSGTLIGNVSRHDVCVAYNELL